MNKDGHKAETGIEGQKKGVNAVFAFVSAQNHTEVNIALDLITDQLESNPDSAAEIDRVSAKVGRSSRAHGTRHEPAIIPNPPTPPPPPPPTPRPRWYQRS